MHNFIWQYEFLENTSYFCFAGARNLDFFVKTANIGPPLGFFRGFFSYQVHAFLPTRGGTRDKLWVGGYVCSFVVFNGLSFSLNWVFTLIAFRQKENAVQCRLEWFFLASGAKTNYFIAKHLYTRRFVGGRSILEVSILERAWPLW